MHEVRGIFWSTGIVQQPFGARQALRSHTLAYSTFRRVRQEGHITLLSLPARSLQIGRLAALYD